MVAIPAGAFRMGDVDGGGTFVYGPPGLRSANCVWNETTYRVWYQGFRIAENQ